MNGLSVKSESILSKEKKMDAYQTVIIGESRNYEIPSLDFFLRVRMYLSILSILKTYKKHGATEAFKSLSKLTKHRKWIFKNKTVEYLFIRKAVSECQLILNLATRGKALCLERSVAVCAGLLSLGFPVQIVIGRNTAMNSSDNFEFHAWVEWNEKPINDWLSIQTHFEEVYRIPNLGD